MQVHNVSLSLFLLSLSIAVVALLSAFASIPFLSIQVFWMALLLSILGYVLLVLFKVIATR